MRNRNGRSEGIATFGTGFVVLLTGLSLVAGCGGGGEVGPSTQQAPSTPPSGPSEPQVPEPGPDPEEPACDESFDSTYDAVQSVIFERQGCANDACHGNNASGGLDLRADVSYANLFEAPSTASALARVHPGTKERSFLWLKLSAAGDPSVEITGSPMPLGNAPLPENEMELLRMWIQSGAPETGTVVGTEELLDACLPDPEPITIEPLDPPVEGDGVQLVMPGWDLPAASENEICFATYYDFSDQIPDEYKSADGKFFYYDAFEIRQDPSSHHLLMQIPIDALRGEEVDPSLVAGWACMGGERAGSGCDPRDASACGAGVCASPIEPSSGCSGYSAAPQINPITFTGTQQAQFARENYPGVYAQIPTRSIVFWNSHAFNLTMKGSKMNARANFRFARERSFPSRTFALPNFSIPRLIIEGARPYTEKEMCDTTVLPRGARLTGLNSHTHKRGKHFWYELPNGEHIYDSYVYNDPLQKYFDPPLEFDAEDPAERTIRFCALFNNGVDDDGNPDPEAVTRASRIPYGVRLNGSDTVVGLCEPLRCVNPDMFDVDCDDGIQNQAGDDAACDSAPGAGDGVCDACPIVGGVTTENEMFGPSISYFVQP